MQSCLKEVLSMSQINWQLNDSKIYEKNNSTSRIRKLKVCFKFLKENSSFLINNK